MRKSSPEKPARRRARPNRKPADRYHHGDLRQALIDAAVTQVDREGPDSLSLLQLAKSLAVSQPAPYRHFRDRDALMAAVATEGFRAFAAALTQAADAGSADAALSRMCQAYVTFGTRRQGIYRLMFASPILLDRAADDELKSAARDSFGLLVAALPERGNPRAREQQAVRIWVALHGIVMLANQGLLANRDSSVNLAELVDTVLAG